MKKYFFIFYLLACPFISVFSQYTWSEYLSGQEVYSSVMQGDDLWVGTLAGGIIKINTVTESKTVFTKLNTGLLGNDVRAITVDNSGNIYAAFTEKGIMKYDGSTWTTITTNNSYYNDLEINPVTNQLWIGTSSGLYVYDGVSVSYSTFNSQLIEKDVEDIAFESDGTMWFGTDGGGLNKISGTTLTKYTTSNSDIPEDEVLSVMVDNGVIWMGCNGLTKFTGSAWTNYSVSNSNIPTSSIYDIKKDDNGLIWLATYGLVSFNGTTFTQYIGSFPILFMRCLEMDASGRIWTGTETFGMYKFQSGTFTAYTLAESGLGASGVRSIAFDQNDIIWVGLNSSYFGVSTLSGSTWQTFGKSDPDFNSNHAWKILVDGSNKKWISTWNGLFKHDDVSWTKYIPANSSIPSEVIHDMDLDENNNLWLATESGLAKYDGSTFQVFKTTNSSIVNNNVYKVHVDAGNVVWISYLTVSSTLSRFDGTTWTTYNTSNSSIPASGITNINSDHSGNIWLTSYDGVTKFDGTDWTTYNTSNSGLPANYTSYVVEDQNNVLWFSHNNYGLSKFDGTSWETFSPSNSPIPTMFAGQITIDDENRKWIALNGGGILILEEGTSTALFKEEDQDAIIHIYPNPGKGRYKISSELPVERVRIFNETGKKVYDNLYNSQEEINMEKEPQGIYFVEIISGSEVLRKKLLNQ